MVQVHIPELDDRAINMFAGARFTCLGKRLRTDDSKEIHFDSSVAVGIRPDHCQELSWNIVHQFAGVFSGWRHAIKGLLTCDIPFNLAQQIEIDSADEVASVWQKLHGPRVKQAPIPTKAPWDPSDCIHVHCPVKEPSLLNLFQFQANVIHTLSPPCQSWSRGGKRLGLSAMNGFAFIEGLQLAFVSQALLIVGECTDEISTHQHYDIILFLAAQFGYRKVWSQITPLHRISPMSRTRWLCVWCRSDVRALPFDCTITPSIAPHTAWQDDAFRFALPATWQNQTLLSDSERTIYGSVDPTSGSSFDTPHPHRCKSCRPECPRTLNPCPLSVRRTLSTRGKRHSCLHLHATTRVQLFRPSPLCCNAGCSR